MKNIFFQVYTDFMGVDNWGRVFFVRMRSTQTIQVDKTRVPRRNALHCVYCQKCGQNMPGNSAFVSGSTVSYRNFKKKIVFSYLLNRLIVLTKLQSNLLNLCQ